jgi:hypothetical protein
MEDLYQLVPWVQHHQISLDVLYLRSEHNIADPAHRSTSRQWPARRAQAAGQKTAKTYHYEALRHTTTKP